MSALVTLTEELTEAILQQYGELQKLNLSNNGLQNIENIVKLSGLEKLTLRCNDLIDIRPLAALGALTDLDLSENRILDARYPHTPIQTHTPHPLPHPLPSAPLTPPSPSLPFLLLFLLP